MAVDLSALAGDADQLEDDTDLDAAHQAELDGGSFDELAPDLDESSDVGPAAEEAVSADAHDLTESPAAPDAAPPASAASPAEPALAAPELALEPEPEPLPFVFRADGQKHTLDGALDYPGHGIYIPESERGKFKQLCAAATTHNGTWRQREREMSTEVSHYRERAELAEKEATALTDMFKPMLGMSAEQRAQWAWEFGQRMPDLFLAARENAINEREQRIRQGSALSYQPTSNDGARLAQAATSELDTTIDLLAGDPAFKVLSESDWDAIREFWTPQVGRLLLSDQRTGTMTFDGRTIQQYAQQLARVRQDTAQRTDAKSQAEAKNARALGSSQVKPPPTVAGRSAPSTAAPAARPRNADGTFASKEEWEAWSRGFAA